MALETFLQVHDHAADREPVGRIGERHAEEGPSAIPADDPNRKLTFVNPDEPGTRHVFVASDTYTVLLTGEDTGGRYCLFEFNVPPGGGPPPHRHDFEEMFTILDGEMSCPFGARP